MSLREICNWKHLCVLSRERNRNAPPQHQKTNMKVRIGDLSKGEKKCMYKYPLHFGEDYPIE